jgi:glutamate-1-semialdehyde aminotransferase
LTAASIADEVVTVRRVGAVACLADADALAADVADLDAVLGADFTGGVFAAAGEAFLAAAPEAREDDAVDDLALAVVDLDALAGAFFGVVTIVPSSVNRVSG